MRTLSLVLAIGLVAPLSGCLVRTRTGPDRTVYRERSCPPAHHWEGGACVHNGRHRGHDKHRD